MCFFGSSPNTGPDEARILASGIGATGFDGAAYLAANPDVAQEATRQTGNAKSDVYGMSPEEFAAYHYGTFGQNEGRSLGAAAPTGADKATDTANDTITNLTNGFNSVLTGIQTSNQGVVDKLISLNTSLTGNIDTLNKNFASSQKELLDGISSASERQSQAMAKALKDMQNAQNAVGQGEKRPNYSRAMARNKDANSGGLSSTMLTGPGGAAAGMTLGRTSLLGA